jgi:hypothetical protein
MDFKKRNIRCKIREEFGGWVYLAMIIVVFIRGLTDVQIF